MQICFVVEATIQAKIETGPVSLQPKLGYFFLREVSASGIKKPKLLSFLTESITVLPWCVNTLMVLIFFRCIVGMFSGP